MKQTDVVIVGGGMVGLSLACGLAEAGFAVTVLEAGPDPQPDEQVDCRVSALSRASEQWLQRLGVWTQLERKTAYRQMRVWEQDGPAALQLDCATVMEPDLGHIVENHSLRLALWQRAEALGVSLQSEVHLQRMQRDEDGLLLWPTAGDPWQTPLAVAADGAESWLRQQARVPMLRRDYGHWALVANVRTQLPHEACARQCFTPEGPLAFLPLHEPDLCSIVWSLPPARAKALCEGEATVFLHQLYAAFDGSLGLCQLASERRCIPLQARLARDFVQERLVLIGDAAHTIHPLAGQGVNLGLLDVAALTQTLLALKAAGQDWGRRLSLRAFERERKWQASQYLIAMAGIQQLFAVQGESARQLRGLGMGLLNRLPGWQGPLLRQALGLAAQR